MFNIKFFVFSILIAAALLASSCTPEPSFWSDKELRVLKSLQLSKLKEDTNSSSNQFANNRDAADFGKRIFFDKRFSATGTISCASCHQENKAFTDGLALAKGVHKTGRNTQTILGAQYHTWFYWDGRKDSLWAQALVPFEAADEMASNRVQVLRIIGKDSRYRDQYESLFGKFPEVIFSTKIPANAGPWGDSPTRDNWYRIPKGLQRIINRAYSNIGKVVAAYERSVNLPTTEFDDYLSVLFSEGEKKANRLLQDDELAGIKLFVDQSKTHCMRCHNGPLLTNFDFHNIDTGTFSGSNIDFGRYLGIQAVVQDEFNCLGEFSDAEPEECVALRFLAKQIHGEMQGAFKTPGLRYLNATGPYFHDGRFTQLEEVLNHYLQIGGDQSELTRLSLSDEETKQIIAFLKLLNLPM